MKPFRFWVQTALPLVYDDSLSYYELLCKVVDYINKFMGDVTQFGEVIEEYTAKVEEIQQYVDGYFDSADFAELVNQSLDQMADDGEFDAIIQAVISAAMQEVTDTLTEVEGVVDGFDDRVEALETVSGQQGLHLATLQNEVDDISEGLDGVDEVWKIVFVSGAAIGDCFYMYKGDEAVLFDCGNDSSATALNASLATHGVTKIKAIVISHWHDDHVNGLSAVLNNNSLSFTNCVMYKPHKNLNYSRAQGSWTSYVPTRDSQYSSLIISKGGNAVYPEEGDEAEIGYLKLVFSNLSNAKFENYYGVMLNENLATTQETNYNNFCMLCNAYLGETKVSFSADAMPECEVQNRDFPAGSVVYKVEHHGLNRKTDTQYANAIGARISVVTDYGQGHVEAMRVKLPTVGRCIGVGSLYDTTNGEVVVEVSKFGAVCVDSVAVNATLYHGALGSSNTLYEGVDFNELVNPGTYSVGNYTLLQQMGHRPEGADSGGKLIVDSVTSSGYVNQVFIQSNSQTPAVHMRCRAWDETNNVYVWRPWRTLRPAMYAEGSTNEFYLEEVNVLGAAQQNRYRIQNGVAFISFYFTALNAITGGNSFLALPIGVRNGEYTPFTLFDRANHTFYYCVAGGYNNELQVWCSDQIPANTTLEGYVCMNLYTNYPI